MEQDRLAKGMRRTRLGLLLLIPGVLLSWVPMLFFLGDIIMFAGAVLLLAGGRAFGPRHLRNILKALLVYIVGFLAGVVASFSVALAMGGLLEPRTGSAAFTHSVQTGTVSALVAGVITGLALLLLTYTLQDRKGRVLVWTAYGCNVAIQVAMFVAIELALPGYAAQATPSGTLSLSADQDFHARFLVFQLLGALPSALYALAFHRAWLRVKLGEVPPAAGLAIVGNLPSSLPRT